MGKESDYPERITEHLRSLVPWIRENYRWKGLQIHSFSAAAARDCFQVLCSDLVSKILSNRTSASSPNKLHKGVSTQPEKCRRSVWSCCYIPLLMLQESNTFTLFPHFICSSPRPLPLSSMQDSLICPWEKVSLFRISSICNCLPC